jgi:L-asparaginase / beta-aspartyl-peptidase
MIVVASSNGKVGINQAMAVLKAGGSALDAVEAGIIPVENNLEDDSVGLGGFPNILGVVEQDASLMNGRTLEAGAVGCVTGFPHPISIARQVIEALPHVFLVGAGADRFAGEMGFERKVVDNGKTRKAWEDRLKAALPEGVFETLNSQEKLAEWVFRVADPKRAKGTVNFIAQDAYGDIACGVSTSGWYAKYPGRLGDSPVIGAGNYADNRYGAAACTGMGEMAIRAGTARSVVLYLKMGMSLEEAGREAMKDLNDLGGNYLSGMNIVALDKNGNPAGFTNTHGATFIYMKENMTEPVEAPRTLVETRKKWGPDN